MPVVEGMFYRIVYDEEKGVIEVEFEPWELTSAPKGSVSEEYFQDVVRDLREKGFSVEEYGKAIMLKGSFGSNAKEVFEYAKKILEDYETKIMLKKTAC